ncbi:MAG: ABC transporter permease [Burkholderiales bacterium]|nr:ABC transporter permease [Burkholderiales bacterium]
MVPGGILADRLARWRGALVFAGATLAAAASPSSYDAQARTLALRQIWFTAGEILPGFALFAALAAAVTATIAIEAARDFGLSQFALELVMRVLVLELAPLFTALFVALRSGAAIATEIALAAIAGDFERMRAEGRDPLACEFAPRVAAAAASVASLTVFACTLALAIAYAAMYGASPWGFEEYTRAVGRVFGGATLAGLALKCVLFGAAVALFPIQAGLSADRRRRTAPVAVRAAMVRVFAAIAAIEIAALAARYVG